MRIARWRQEFFLGNEDDDIVSERLPYGNGNHCWARLSKHHNDHDVFEGYTLAVYISRPDDDEILMASICDSFKDVEWLKDEADKLMLRIVTGDW